jgi:hypothetical protein
MHKPFSDPGTTRPMSAESVSFKNGMIVTADDLSTAMHYPIALMQALNKAVYGCGVVCGFKLGPDPELCGRTGKCDPCDNESDDTFPNFVVEIGRGTALDCHGLPIELCKPVRVDVSPETCGCKDKGGTVCLFIRRVSASETPRGDCCAPAGSPVDYSRQRDHVLIKAFPLGEEPKHACMYSGEESDGHDCVGFESEPCGPVEETSDPGYVAGATGVEDEVAVAGQNPDWDNARQKVCRCLIECDDCECCGDGWVLLGCVELCPGGIVKSSLECDRPYRRRKWIKTIECLCCKEKPKPVNSGDDCGDVSEQPIAAEDDRQLELMRVKDPEIERKIELLVSSQAHRSVFRVQDIRNLDHFIYVLENRKDDLKELFQFARAPEKLDKYLVAARSWRDTGRTPRG